MPQGKIQAVVATERLVDDCDAHVTVHFSSGPEPNNAVPCTRRNVLSTTLTAATIPACAASRTVDIAVDIAQIKRF
ncbi:MAG: hypothetical protein ABSG46_06760 [Candidatus Binataceae bacterium]|jgi:hypothetical protein